MMREARTGVVVMAADGKDSKHSPIKVLKARAVSTVVAACMIIPLIASPDEAMAARSGGRAGGGGSFRSAPRSAPRSYAAPRTNVQNNYYRGGGSGVLVMPAPVYSPFSPFGFGFSPFGGFGTGYAFGSLNSASRDQQYRLENKVDQEQDKISSLEKELEESKKANENLEKRLDQLEQTK